MVLTWSAGKLPIREHPISPDRCVEKLRDSSADQLQRRGIGVTVERSGWWWRGGTRVLVGEFGREWYTALMSTESIGLVVVLSILALGMLYATKGSLMSAQWWAWIRRACFAAGAIFAIGMLTLGLPGAMFVEVLIPAGRELPPDSAWPLAILVT